MGHTHISHNVDCTVDWDLGLSLDPWPGPGNFAGGGCCHTPMLHMHTCMHTTLHGPRATLAARRVSRQPTQHNSGQHSSARGPQWLQAQIRVTARALCTHTFLHVKEHVPRAHVHVCMHARLGGCTCAHACACTVGDAHARMAVHVHACARGAA